MDETSGTAFSLCYGSHNYTSHTYPVQWGGLALVVRPRPCKVAGDPRTRSRRLPRLNDAADVVGCDVAGRRIRRAVVAAVCLGLGSGMSTVVKRRDWLLGPP